MVFRFVFHQYPFSVYGGAVFVYAANAVLDLQYKLRVIRYPLLVFKVYRCYGRRFIIRGQRISPQVFRCCGKCVSDFFSIDISNAVTAGPPRNKKFLPLCCAVTRQVEG